MDLYWGETNDLQKSAEAKLSDLQKQACLAITEALRLSPIVAVETNVGLSPIHIYMDRRHI